MKPDKIFEILSEPDHASNHASCHGVCLLQADRKWRL